MRLGRLSPKQREIASYGGRPNRWTLVSGPVGSGKTESGLIGFLLWQRQLAGMQLGVLTKGHAQLSAVLKDGLERLLGEPLRPHRDGGFQLPGRDGQTNHLIPFVCQDARGIERMRSFNLGGMLLDEMTTLPFPLLAECAARTRVGDAKILGLTNPDGPLHPVKKHFFDKAEEHDAYVVWTDLRDNPALTQAYVDDLKKRYTGAMLERMVYGRWAASTGLVYPRLYEFSTEAPDCDFTVYDVSVDVGEARVTAALLSGRTADGRTWILDEVTHDHVREGVLSESELVAKIRRAFSGYEVNAWIVDPAAKRFRQEMLRQMPDARVGKAVNHFDEGVEEVNHWLASDALFVWGEKVPQLMTENGEYVWDPDMAKIGRDEPVKIRHDLLDCLRYLIMTRTVDELGGMEAWLRRERQRKEARL